MTIEKTELEQTRDEFTSLAKRTARTGFKSLGFGVSVLDKAVRKLIAAMITFVIFSFLLFQSLEYFNEWNEMVKGLSTELQAQEEPFLPTEIPTENNQSDVPVVDESLYM